MKIKKIYNDKHLRHVNCNGENKIKKNYIYYFPCSTFPLSTIFLLLPIYIILCSWYF